ncbi:MAG TPA: OmpH family outer membrane protein [Candidatus Binataceae bacterium]|nr:OmpH family outer membrane protein [Candidatus Binataceae bacterium]
MRQPFIIIGALLIALASAIPARADVKLAYVDVQRALNECDAGKRAKADFQGKVSGLEARLQRQQNDVQALKDEIEKKGMLMNPDQRQNLQDQYMTKLKNFERDYKDSRDELQQKDADVTSRIVHDLAQVIRGIGERDGFTMVLEKGSILWGAPGIDITDEVIRSYNATHVQIGTLGEGGGAASQSYAGASQPSDFGGSIAKKSTISK